MLLLWGERGGKGERKGRKGGREGGREGGGGEREREISLDQSQQTNKRFYHIDL